MTFRFFSFLLAAVTLTMCVSCATAYQPFATPADAALKQELTAKLGDYTRTMEITVSGGRVYMGGELRNHTELMDAMGIIRETKGVTSVIEEVFLTDIGPQGGDNGFD